MQRPGPLDHRICQKKVDQIPWEGLATCEVYRQELKHWGLVNCDSCDGSMCGDPRRVLGYSFPRCPFSMLREPAWHMVVRTYNAMHAQKGGLAMWPDGYLSYIEDGVTALVSATNKKQAEELDKMRGAQNGH